VRCPDLAAGKLHSAWLGVPFIYQSQPTHGLMTMTGVAGEHRLVPFRAIIIKQEFVTQGVG
jgi:hypothetical protein